MVHYFNQGGIFMWPILIVLVVGIMISIERFISLTRASVNTRKFLAKIKDALSSGGVDEAIDVCTSTRGPVASIFHAGLLRSKRGVEHAEKAITNAGLRATRDIASQIMNQLKRMEQTYFAAACR